MKNTLLAILISFTVVVAIGHADSKIFSHEVLQIIHKHWTSEDKVFIQLYD
jgi:ribosome biogenesis protein Tsr3